MEIKILFFAAILIGFSGGIYRNCKSIKSCNDCIESDCLYSIWKDSTEICVPPTQLLFNHEIETTIQSIKGCARLSKRKSIQQPTLTKPNMTKAPKVLDDIKTINQSRLSPLSVITKSPIENLPSTKPSTLETTPNPETTTYHKQIFKIDSPMNTTLSPQAEDVANVTPTFETTANVITTPTLLADVSTVAQKPLEPTSMSNPDPTTLPITIDGNWQQLAAIGSIDKGIAVTTEKFIHVKDVKKKSGGKRERKKKEKGLIRKITRSMCQTSELIQRYTDIQFNRTLEFWNSLNPMTMRKTSCIKKQPKPLKKSTGTKKKDRLVSTLKRVRASSCRTMKLIEQYLAVRYSPRLSTFNQFNPMRDAPDVCKQSIRIKSAHN